MENVGTQIFSSVPCLNGDNYEAVLPDTLYGAQNDKDNLFLRFQGCTEMLNAKYGNEVDGMWLVSEPTFDEGLRVIVRTKQKMSAAESNRLHADVFHFVKHDRMHEITATDISEITELSPLPIGEWLQSKKIYAVFDNERRG